MRRLEARLLIGARPAPSRPIALEGSDTVSALIAPAHTASLTKKERQNAPLASVATRPSRPAKGCSVAGAIAPQARYRLSSTLDNISGQTSAQTARLTSAATLCRRQPDATPVFLSRPCVIAVAPSRRLLVNTLARPFDGRPLLHSSRLERKRK